VDPVALHRAGEFPAAKVPKRYVMPQRATELFVDDVRPTGGCVDTSEWRSTWQETVAVPAELPSWATLTARPCSPVRTYTGDRPVTRRQDPEVLQAVRPSAQQVPPTAGRSCLADPELGAAVLGASRTLTGGDHYLEETVRTRKDVQRARTRPLSRVDEKRSPRARATVNQLLDRYLEVVELGPI
jgi:hypothetical protein